MKLITLTLLVPLMVGCANPFVRIVEQEVPVPIPCPVPAKVEKPQLPIHSLSENDKRDYNKVGKAYVNTIILLDAYSKSLEKALEPYRTDQ